MLRNETHNNNLKAEYANVTNQFSEQLKEKDLELQREKQKLHELELKVQEAEQKQKEIELSPESQT